MSALADAKAISTTATAKAASVAKGMPLDLLMESLQLKLVEIQLLLKEIIRLTPSADANILALNNLLAELL